VLDVSNSGRIRGEPNQMSSEAEARAACKVVHHKLERLLGPELQGVNAFGLAFDPRSRELFVRVDLDPEVPLAKRRQIPGHVDDVPVRVELVGPGHLE
jgi:hypothetical protein